MKNIELKSKEEIKRLFEKVVSEFEDSPADDYIEGIWRALGWVLGIEEDPLE